MERVYRWFGWHPVLAGFLSGIPGLMFEAPMAAPPPAARSPVSVSVAISSPPQVVVQREVIERQVIVMRCAHCGELTPVDLSKCKNCGASIGA